MSERFEEAVIAHCAPTLAGHKCGSLFSWLERPAGRIWRQDLEQRQPSASDAKGRAASRLLKCCPAGAGLVYVYRVAAMLRKRLERHGRSRTSCMGRAMPSPQAVRRAGQRWRAKHGHSRRRNFPTRLAIFLDYPLADVIGFIRHQGAAFCCVGCWKAYTNEEQARRTFALYTQVPHGLPGLLP